jgi:CRP-like cAMP-binding protein
VIDRFLMKLRARHDVSVEEEQVLRACVSEVRDVPDNKTIIHANEELTTCTLLLEGMLARYKDLRDGQRQVTELHVPGDFADLHSFTLKRLDHSIGTLTSSKIALVPHERLRAVTEMYPHLTRLLWFSTNLDASIHREWELSLGRRSALSRTAQLFCELYHRLDIVGLTEGQSYDLPLTQTDLSECLGLTAVHVNRTLREMREAGLVEFRGRRVVIADLKGLKAVAEFEGRYLYLERVPL